MGETLIIKDYRPNYFVPSTSYTGDEVPLVIRGENMWIRIGRYGSVYAEGYTGSQDLSETIPTKQITNVGGGISIAWTSGSKTVTGTGTSFLSDLHLGSFVFGDGGAGATELFVVEKIISNTSFICCKAPAASASGREAYILPILFPVGTDRGTAIRGNVIQFYKGHYLGVGDGTFRINGNTLTNSLTLSKTPTFALHNPATGNYTINTVGLATPTIPPTLAAVTPINVTGVTAATPIVITVAAGAPATGERVTIGEVIGVPEANGSFIVTNISGTQFSLNGTVGTGAYVSGGLLYPTRMLAGGYNIRICRSNSSTLGFSNPSPVITPVTLGAIQAIRITFNEAMVEDQDSWDIYGTEFIDNSTSTIEARYQGPWWKVKRVTAAELIDGSHATGRETGTTHVFSYSDSEVALGGTRLSFDNFSPVDSEFVDMINGIPIYFSCLGQGNTAKLNGTSPGPVGIPSKPSNPEAVFLNKAFTMSGGDYIIGEFNAKSRIYALGQNTLQNVILTTVDVEPIAFRSLWNSGFRNPYNLAFVKEYLYAHSTQGIVRSVAGGDDSAVEFEFATDLNDYVVNFECGHELSAYDPKNKAMCFFYSAHERRSGYWVTMVIPFLVEKGVWNPPIILSLANSDFIVSGVATIGNKLNFLAGGRTSGGSIVVKTYVFDGGDSTTKSWNMCWGYADDGNDVQTKRIQGITATGRFASSDTKVKTYGVGPNGEFKYSDLAAGTNADNEIAIGASGGVLKRMPLVMADTVPSLLYSLRIEGSYTTTPDRLDELTIGIQANSAAV